MSTLERRRVLSFSALAASAALLLAGCSAGASPSGGGGTVETRTITSEAGEVQIPVDPQTIVALDEAAALNLMSIGISPDAVFASWRTTVPRAIIEEAGIEVLDTAAFYPEVEEVAALNPDLIVTTWAEGAGDVAPGYSEIAPLIGGLFYAPGDEIAEAYGEYFDRSDEAAAVAATLDAATADAKAAQSGEAASLSVVMSYGGEAPAYLDAASSLHDSIAAAGFTRPKLQDEIPEGGSAFGGWTMFSPEQLPEHDADVLAIAVASQYTLEGITGLPLFSSLEAAKNDRAISVDGDLWSGGSAFYTYWVLRDLAQFAAGDFTAGTGADADARWGEYRKSIEG